MSIQIDEVYERLYLILSEQLGVDVQLMNPQSYLVKDLGLDSIDSVEMVLEVEEEFGVRIPVKNSIFRIIDLANFIESQAMSNSLLDSQLEFPQMGSSDNPSPSAHAEVSTIDISDDSTPTTSLKDSDPQHIPGFALQLVSNAIARVSSKQTSEIREAIERGLSSIPGSEQLTLSALGVEERGHAKMLLHMCELVASGMKARTE